MAGPNFGRLGVPVPPNSVSLTDRYQVSCIKETRQCARYVKMMNFVLEMMNLVLEMMNLALKTGEFCI